jgi:hypothetical protein
MTSACHIIFVSFSNKKIADKGQNLFQQSYKTDSDLNHRESFRSGWGGWTGFFYLSNWNPYNTNPDFNTLYTA